MAKLSPAEGKLLMKLALHKDTPIRDLYRAACGCAPPKTMSNRDQQAIVGAYVSRMNVKLADEGKCIKPGITKQTYTLAAVR